MVKRKEQDNELDLDEDDVVNVDFDFFDIVEDDFLSLKSLLRQLLGIDNVEFNLSALTQLIVESKVGTTIKADDEEYNDVLAVLAITDFDCHQGETAKLLEYWIEQCRDTPEMLRVLYKLKTSQYKVGLLISERFLNMPYEVVPPLFNVLAQEYATKKLGYDYLVFPSRVYAERESQLNAPTPIPKAKKGTGQDVTEYFPFHMEDSVIHDQMVCSTRFTFKKPIEETDSRRAFQDLGIHPYGHISVLEASKLGDIAAKVAALTEQ